MGTENPSAEHWLGADVPLDQAHEWIAARVPDRPAGESPEVAALRHCAACGSAIFPPPGAGEKAPGAFGFDWHDFCFESYPFLGRTRY